MRGLVCLDMDRVLVDHLSTWQFVYDRLGINNDESFSLYNQGLLDEWDWIKLDIALIKNSWREQHGTEITDSDLRACMEGMPMMKNTDGSLFVEKALNPTAKAKMMAPVESAPTATLGGSSVH